MEKKTVISVQNVSMRFNMPKERLDSFKEYFVKFFKHQLHYEEFCALTEMYTRFLQPAKARSPIRRTPEGI